MAEIGSLSSAIKEMPKDEVIRRLHQCDALELLSRIPPLQGRKAAVLVPLFYKDDELYILLTVRSKHLRAHGGEVALPGGKQDETDADFKETALRESEEEVGLPQDEVEVISHLGPVFAKAGTMVVPVVGFISKDFSPVANADEVQDIFCAPLSLFLKGDDHLGKNYGKHLVHFFNFSDGEKDYTIFGMTAFVCIIVATICFARGPDFEMSQEFDPANPIKMTELSYMRRVAIADKERNKGKL
ncbi:peroxisomal coenzyme A diphosphatase NUDT7-like [Asterias rubens]|uniref:peroxisomal coenzyme A diphosphatase NUDT7-like n=1 Tax=Asterias rubens TaxID=7604 RepID=UPI0014559CF0|nr:peroxisomal coenzyme A diphosphatase NUDT7-like [Asterias rubens]